MNAPSENRIAQKFRELQEHNRKAFVAYITAGDPSPEMTPQLVWALERAGADIVELGEEGRSVACWLHSGDEGVVVPVELSRTGKGKREPAPMPVKGDVS